MVKNKKKNPVFYGREREKYKNIQVILLKNELKLLKQFFFYNIWLKKIPDTHRVIFFFFLLFFVFLSEI